MMGMMGKRERRDVYYVSVCKVGFVCVKGFSE